MDPLISASLISAGGSLVGGLLGSSSSSKEASKNRKEARRQFNIQQDNFMNQTQYRVQDALKAGINPLAALGVSSNVSPTFSAGGGSDAGYQKGNAISRAAEHLSNIFNRQEKESRDLDLEAKRIRNRIAKEELNHLLQPGLVSNGSVDDSPSNPKNPDWQIPMKMSLRDAEPLYLPWRTPDGRVVELLNPDAIADADITNMEAVRAYASDIKTPVKGTRQALRDSVGARENIVSGWRRSVNSWLNKRARRTGKYWLYGRR